MLRGNFLKVEWEMHCLCPTLWVPIARDVKLYAGRADEYIDLALSKLFPLSVRLALEESPLVRWCAITYMAGWLRESIIRADILLHLL